MDGLEAPEDCRYQLGLPGDSPSAATGSSLCWKLAAVCVVKSPALEAYLAGRTSNTGSARPFLRGRLLFIAALGRLCGPVIGHEINIGIDLP